MSRRSSDTRHRILEATIARLESQGGAGVRMADIAKATGISRQAVYLHFATRAELLIAAARHLDAVALEQLVDLCATVLVHEERQRPALRSEVEWRMEMQCMRLKQPNEERE